MNWSAPHFFPTIKSFEASVKAFSDKLTDRSFPMPTTYAIKGSSFLKHDHEASDPIYNVALGALKAMTLSSQMRSSFCTFLGKDLSETEVFFCDLIDQDLRQERSTLRLLHSASDEQLAIIQLVAKEILPHAGEADELTDIIGCRPSILMRHYRPEDFPGITAGIGIHILTCPTSIPGESPRH